MKYFFSVDWGTSSLRVRLVSTNENEVTILKESTSPYGCSYVDTLFKEEKRSISREDYFFRFLNPYLVLPDSIATEKPVPVVISGMAASSIGIREIPYSQLPFSLSGTDLQHALIPATRQFNHTVLLLSGLCSTDDVMRGEEVQLLGLQKYFSNTVEAMYILPGTHSKHILVRNNEIISFKTYISGELFQLLSTYSLLKNSITKSTSLNEESFKWGLNLSKENILHTVFTIRAASLLQKTESTRNYSLLSGILIGTELRNLAHSTIPVYLCAHENLSRSYALAIRELSLQQKCTVISSKEVDESVIHGQKIILENARKQLEDLCKIRGRLPKTKNP